MNLQTYPYTRVLPRDLFNESKLLKCLGFIALHIHEGTLKGLTLITPDDGDPDERNRGYLSEAFKIGLCDEGLFIQNLTFTTRKGHDVFFVSPYNSREAFPLHFESEPFCFEPVFTDSGEYSPEFLAFLAN